MLNVDLFELVGVSFFSVRYVMVELVVKVVKSINRGKYRMLFLLVLVFRVNSEWMML